MRNNVVSSSVKMNYFHYFLFTIIINISFHIGESSETTKQDVLDFENKKMAAIPSVLKVSSWNDMPFSGIIQENGQWIGTGYAFYILDLLSDKLNFTYTIVPPTGQIFGNKNRGILSMLYKKEVDMIVSFVPVLEDLRKYCLFSTTLDVLELTAMMKRPEESATGSGLLAPFDNTVWFCVLTAVLVVGPTIYIFSLIRLKLWKGTEGENYNLPSCMWFVYSALLKQGSTIIAQTEKLYLGERHYFRKLLFEDYINKTREGLEHNKRCTYVIMPGSILSRNRAFAFPLNSTIVDGINMVLSSLIESGLIKHKKISDLPLANVCPVDLQSTERQLRNTDLSLTYEVIAAGYIIAMIVFIIELIIKYINYCTKNKKDAKQSSKIPKQIIKYQENSEQSLWASRLPLYDTTNNNHLRDNNVSLIKRTPPPVYHYNEGNTSFLGKRHNINGRNYYVVVDRSGSQRLIPIRTPSAFLFQYTA
ncbi:hypothetical protein M0802_007326 [Mischocyttarus mexicanus]|nr:hypothetical protein M0802_007326 [Mischocyttarus mexicanus]